LTEHPHTPKNRMSRNVRKSEGTGAAPGRLYVVATPLGNLEDMSFRAVRQLREADLIAAESRDHTGKLCRHFEIRTPVISYNQNNRARVEPRILGKLRSGSDVALVSSAGTPGLSDPGVPLVNRALSEGIRVIPIPGPCAAVAALSASGLALDGFLFCGFLSPKSGRRKKELERIAREPLTLVFYEAPRRVDALLQDLLTVLGDRRAVLAREMTKVHEEFLRGPLSALIGRLEGETARGELTILVEGAGHGAPGDETVDQDLESRAGELLREGRMTLGDTARTIAGEFSVNYRQAYRVCLEIKNSLRREENRPNDPIK